MWTMVRRSVCKRGTPPGSLFKVSNAERDPGAERIGVFAFRDGPNAEPAHLRLLDQSALVPIGSQPIHLVHVQGLPHGGVWMFIVDSGGRLLVLKRAASLRTCANKWGLLGEHQWAGESPHVLADRAVDEELGPQLRQFVIASHNLTAGPVWYRRDYADGRIDRQATWLWAMLLAIPAEQVQLAPDAEVAEYRWVSTTQIADWVKKSPSDFCHSTIVSLLDLAITRLRLVL